MHKKHSLHALNIKITINTVSYKEQFLIKLASTKNVTFNVSCIKKILCSQNCKNHKQNQAALHTKYLNI
jgi:hypothetical protein